MKESKFFLKHIMDEIEYLQQKLEKLKYEDFVKDEDLKRIFVRSLEIIGEATKNLNEDFRSKYHQVEWKKMARLRDVLIHQYWGISYERVWDIVKNQIPELKLKIEIILQEIDKNRN